MPRSRHQQRESECRTVGTSHRTPNRVPATHIQTFKDVCKRSKWIAESRTSCIRGALQRNGQLPFEPSHVVLHVLAQIDKLLQLEAVDNSACLESDPQGPELPTLSLFRKSILRREALVLGYYYTTGQFSLSPSLTSPLFTSSQF